MRLRARSGSSGILVGGVIVIIGLLLLLDNLGIVRFHDVWRYWPVLLIVWGGARCLEATSPSGYVRGGLAVLIGSLILLDNLEILIFDFNLIWPLLLIGFGVSMLARSIERKKYMDGAPMSSDQNLGIWTVFGGVKRKIDAQDFKGGDVVAVFGGVHLDLRKAAIAGERAVIDITAVFGGVDIRIPEEWSVTVKGAGIFGAFDDKTIHPRADLNVKTPQLIITGTAMFGGAKVDN